MSAGPTTLPVAIADARLADHHRQFVARLDSAEHLAKSGQDEAAVWAAADAAAFAWLNHPGVHASPRLERLLRSLAPRGARATTRASPSRGRRQRVLHVLSQVYPTGGHSRLTERMIRADHARTHSVALIAQNDEPIPGWFERSVIGAGGQIHVFQTGGLIGRAIALRELANRADLVIANAHPPDVVPFLAFADPRDRPPLGALNAADHCFWLGASAWDLLANMRRSGEELALRRRGVPASRSTILALPLVDVGRTMSREDARLALGIRPTEIVLISAGANWKFDPHEMRGEPTFPEVLTPIVERDQRLRLFVLGPTNDGRWAEASRRTNGRLLALGTRTDYDLYQQAADIYLDPFPMVSLYSLLEPGSLGVPILSYRQWPDEAGTLAIDSPGLGDGPLVATTRDAYEAALLALVSDPAAREARGARTSEQILAAHAGSAWQEALGAFMAALPGAREAHLAGSLDLPAELDIPSFGTLDRGLVTIVPGGFAIPERVVSHLPLAAAPEEPTTTASSDPKPRATISSAAGSSLTLTLTAP